MKNNRLFVVMPSMAELKMEDLRNRLERDDELFDRHGSWEGIVKSEHFGFVTCVPRVKDSGRVKWFMRMLRCSYVYLPCGWHNDKVSRKAFIWADVLGKRVIFEEDGRCR